MTDSPLGRKSNYPDRYDPSLLICLNRADSRQKLRLDTNHLGIFGILGLMKAVCQEIASYTFLIVVIQNFLSNLNP